GAVAVNPTFFVEEPQQWSLANGDVGRVGEERGGCGEIGTLKGYRHDLTSFDDTTLRLTSVELWPLLFQIGVRLHTAGRTFAGIRLLSGVDSALLAHAVHEPGWRGRS